MTRRPLRVLLITSRADVGGGPLHVDLLAQHLPKSVDRWIACPDEPPYMASWRTEPSVRGVLPIARRSFSVSDLLSLARACRRWGIDVVHSHGKAAGVYSRLLKLLLPRLRVLHTFHGVHIGQYGTVRRAAYLTVERLLRPLTDGFVCVSAGERRQCVALRLAAPDRTLVIHNGLPPLVAESDGEHCVPNGVDTPVIVTLARFEYQKHMSLALEIAALAHRQRRPWTFLWAGDGPERAGIQTRAGQLGLVNVRFLGSTNQRAELLASADVFLSTSRWEGLPYALIEASSMGVPIVATRVTGNDEVVTDGVNGYLFEPTDAAAALRALEKILTDQSLRARLSEGGRQITASRFSLQRSIDETARLYETVGAPRV
ncbi:MAG: glycosyltransferase [Gemmatimonadaceae bacterium]|nr:glycosyltransferase [Gemmatimonadaceae bacterium]